MDVILYKFNKRLNSTALPTQSTTSLSADCVLKEDSSIVNPILSFSFNFSSSPSSYNYVYIEEYSRYYFITNWTFSAGIWYASLRTDVLGSFKTEIGNSYFYVLRSASEHNSDLKDTMYPVTLTTHNSIKKTSGTVSDLTDEASITNYFSKTFENGYYVIGVVGNNNTGVTYYSMSYSSFAYLMSVLAQYQPSDMADISLGIAKQVVNLLQYITSCYWYPSSPGGFLTTRTIYFGYYPVQVPNCGVLGTDTGEGKAIHAYGINITLDKHPQCDATGNNYAFLNTSPYTERILIFNPFGAFNLDTSRLSLGASSSGIYCKWYVDFTTGMADLYVFDSETKYLLVTTSAQFGVPIRVSQLTVNMIQVMKDTTIPIIDGLKGALMAATVLAVPASAGAVATLGTAGMVDAGILGGALVGSAIGNVESRIASTLDRNPTVTSLGSNGSILPFNSELPSVYSTFYDVADMDNTRNGRPLCEIKKLNTLSGFIKCQSGDVAISGYANENEAIISFLVSGFFYE